MDKDSMTWWQVDTVGTAGQPLRGWMAEALTDGTALMEKTSTTGPGPAVSTFAPGDLAVTADYAKVRRSPGVNNKPGDDVLGMFIPKTTVNILSGPDSVDGLTWWRVGGILVPGGDVRGYVAESAPGGAPILAPAAKLPGTNIPDKASGAYLHAPFDGQYDITQLWGENSDYYRQFNYDGVALLGHNGIDFLTPNGTVLLAPDSGQVARVGFEPGGFGNYVLLSHPWGESIYAHMESIGVTEGQIVGRGQYIGASDNSGGSTGPHLHFAIRINPYNRADGWGGFSDPLPYLPPSSFALPPYVQDPDASAMLAAAAPAPGDASLRSTPPSMGQVPGSKRP